MQIELNKKYNLELTGEELILVEKTLQKLPFEQISGVLTNIIDRVKPATKARVKKPKQI